MKNLVQRAHSLELRVPGLFPPALPRAQGGRGRPFQRGAPKHGLVPSHPIEVFSGRRVIESKMVGGPAKKRTV